MNEAKDIGVWIEPENAIEARKILHKVDLNKIIPFTTRKHRLDQLSWSTLAKLFYFSRNVLQDHQPDDVHGGDDDTDDDDQDGGDDDDDTDDDDQDSDDDDDETDDGDDV